ncbi:MAG TPA: phage tail protein [Pyrinomonadaceae bacterium]|jgi:T4-like virus tail tube protein gp19|nr:phage tail protein [Pyrinomonadaceae bacterium]
MGNFGVVVQNYLLELDGRPAGRLSGVSTMALKAKVDLQTTGADSFASKKLTAPAWDDISFTCGAGMARAFYDWLKETFNHSFTKKNGAIVAIDAKRKEVLRIDFTNALIKSIVLPKLDHASKENAFITVKFQPESATISRSGKDANLGSYGSAHAKPWSIANFALSISGLEKEAADVTKIEPLGMGQQVIEDSTAGSRAPQLTPGSADYPNLAFTLSASMAQSFFDWFETSVTKGSAGIEKTGTLEYRGSDTKTVYFSLQFSGLGMSQGEISKSAGKSPQPVVISMYYDSVQFSAHSSAIL